MKKSTLLFAFSLLCIPAANAQAPQFSAKALMPSPKAKKEAGELRLVSKPQHETVYATDEDGKWTKDYENRYTYDEHGNILTLVTDNGTTLTKVESTYDEKGQLLTETTWRTDEGSSEYKPRMKKEYTYDPEIFDLATSFEFSTISGGQWTPFPGSCYKQIVERNADGNITSITKQVLGYDGQYSDQSKIVFTFNEGEKQPSGYEYLIAGSNGLTAYTTYTDMKWSSFTPPLAKAYSLSWFMNGNFLESATVSDDTYGDIKLTATHDDNGNFEVMNVYNDMPSQKQKLKYETTDKNGSFMYYNLLYYNTSGGEATEADLYGGTTMQVDYDVWGNEKVYEECQITQYGGLDAPQVTDGVRNSFVYGGPHGEVTEAVTQSFNANTGAYETTAKVVSDDFVDVMTGISSAKADKPAAKGVYNLQGMKLEGNTDNLPKGIYIINGKKILK